MRIAGTIPHPAYKITIFKMNNRYSIKIENPFYAQTYKLREGQVENIDDVYALVNDDFMKQVDIAMQEMHKGMMERLK